MFYVQWFWWSRAPNHCKNQAKPPKTTTNNCKNTKKQKQTQVSNYPSTSKVRGFSWFLQWSWWSRQTTKHHEKTMKTIVKTKKTKKHHFQIISQNRVLVFFLYFYRGFELLTTKTTVKTHENHEFLMLRNNLKIVFFLCFLISQWFWCFFLV